MDDQDQKEPRVNQWLRFENETVEEENGGIKNCFELIYEKESLDKWSINNFSKLFILRKRQVGENGHLIKMIYEINLVK